ncbi:MAG: sugar phosphate isomerase/epimerase family protein [Planctomycetota bacterium]|nr:sugar phosphate isomerase/epimerase family protein [Planctomycetota bacterium]
MATLAMNQMTTYRWSFEKDVEQYLAAGIGQMGVWRPKLADIGESEALDLLAESGLGVSSLHWAGGFTGSDARSYTESLQDAREAIRVAAELQANCLLVHSGARAGHTRNHARRLLQQALCELLETAQDACVPLALEPMPRESASDWTFLHTLDETMELIDRIGSPWLKIVFDTYHLGHDLAGVDRIPEIVSRIALVQLADATGPPSDEQDRFPLGCGNLPLDEIVGRLRSAGYVGAWEVELMGPEIETSEYHALLRQTVEAFQDLTARGATP